MESFVVLTSPAGTHFATDVHVTPTSASQRFVTEPVALADATYAYAWAADSLWDDALDTQLQYDIWLIMGGVVTDHFTTR